MVPLRLVKANQSVRWRENQIDGRQKQLFVTT